MGISAKLEEPRRYDEENPDSHALVVIEGRQVKDYLQSKGVMNGLTYFEQPAFRLTAFQGG